MIRNNNRPMDFISQCFAECDGHKMQVENHVRQDLIVVFAGLKPYL